MNATGMSATDWVHRYYDDVDHMRMEEFLAWHAPDVVVRFANNPPAHGPEQVRGAIGHFWEMIGGLKHGIVHVWDTGDGTTVVEADIDYTRTDGRVVTTPCVTLLHRSDGGGEQGRVDPVQIDSVQIDSVRIFVDLAPVFAP